MLVTYLPALQTRNVGLHVFSGEALIWNSDGQAHDDGC